MNRTEWNFCRQFRSIVVIPCLNAAVSFDGEIVVWFADLLTSGGSREDKKLITTTAVFTMTTSSVALLTAMSYPAMLATT